MDYIITGGQMRAILDGLATAPEWQCDGPALTQAIRECSGYFKKGQAILFLPCEEGVKLLRYDVKDSEKVHADEVTHADACTTVCWSEWPFPGRIALPGKELAKIAKGAPGVRIRVRDDMAVIATTGNPVARVMAAAICPFADRTDIF